MRSVIRQRFMKYAAIAKCSLLRDEQLTELYFGYGANLSQKRFENYRMANEFHGPAVLYDHKIAYSQPCEYRGKGYANVEEHGGGQVWGVVYALSETSIALMDILEWVPFSFYDRVKKEVTIERTGERTTVWSYVSASPRSGLRPSEHYRELILSESVSYGFPRHYIEEIRNVQVANEFAIDPEFNLACPAKPRRWASKYPILAGVHDAMREKIAEILP